MKLGSKDLPTDRQFFGSIIGDHVKTAINTRFMPGAYVGFCCFLAGSNIVPRFVPSFSFWSDDGRKPIDLDVARRTMKAVYGRRDVRWTDEDDRMISQVQKTAPENEK